MDSRHCIVNLRGTLSREPFADIVSMCHQDLRIQHHFHHQLRSHWSIYIQWYRGEITFHEWAKYDSYQHHFEELCYQNVLTIADIEESVGLRRVMQIAAEWTLYITSAEESYLHHWYYRSFSLSSVPCCRRLYVSHSLCQLWNQLPVAVNRMCDQSLPPPWSLIYFTSTHLMLRTIMSKLLLNRHHKLFITADIGVMIFHSSSYDVASYLSVHISSC